MLKSFNLIASIKRLYSSSANSSTQSITSMLDKKELHQINILNLVILLPMAKTYNLPQT